MNVILLYKTIANDVFSRAEIAKAAKHIDPSFKESQLRFYIGKLKNENLIVSVGRNRYSKNLSLKKRYIPQKTETCEKIIATIKNEYPFISYRVWDLNCLNEFLNHLLAQNHIFLEVEKDGLEFIYEKLKDIFPNKILLNPSKKEIEIYSEPDDIIILPLTSESPTGTNSENEISLEKLIVDLFTNKTLQTFVSKGDYPQALEDMFEKYSINEIKLFRYARRRNKAKEIYDFICEKTNIKLTVEVKG